jgi:arylsulfatase A-like enzyme
MMPILRRAGLLAGLLLLAAACAEDPPPPAPSASASGRTLWKPSAPVSVVLIVIDTLRGDVLLDPPGPDGRYDTPVLDRLAREGIVFSRAFSAAPMTLPSHMSLFSSQPPFQTGVLNNGVTVPADLPLLAEWLSKNGYHSRAVISLGTLNPIKARESPARGFHDYDWDYLDLSQAEHTQERLVASLAARDATKPLFLFAHFSDPHEPYNSHGTEDHRVQVLIDGELLDELVTSDMNQWTREVELSEGRTVIEFRTPPKAKGNWRVRRFKCVDDDGDLVPFEWEEADIMERVNYARLTLDRGNRPASTCKLQAWINDVPVDDDARRRRYALEVAYADRYVGELLAELERRGLYRDSLIVFTSDHGEALGELRTSRIENGEPVGPRRAFFGHAEYLTDEQIHVPLVVKLPQGDPRAADLARVAGEVTTHLDVVPTILELIGVAPMPDQVGTSLLEPHQSVHIAQTHTPEAQKRGSQVALRDAQYKLIFFAAEQRFEMYDLVADPGEEVDVFEERKHERPLWPDQAQMIYRRSDRATSESESEEERLEREAQLKALGYGGSD